MAPPPGNYGSSSAAPMLKPAPSRLSFRRMAEILVGDLMREHAAQVIITCALEQTVVTK